jgi:hypothetical protein
VHGGYFSGTCPQGVIPVALHFFAVNLGPFFYIVFICFINKILLPKEGVP